MNLPELRQHAETATTEPQTDDRYISATDLIALLDLVQEQHRALEQYMSPCGHCGVEHDALCGHWTKEQCEPPYECSERCVATRAARATYKEAGGDLS